MITIQWLYVMAGLMFAAFALLSAMDRSNGKRLGNAAFWGLMALSLLGGDLIGDFGNGLLVLGLAGIAGFGFIGRSAPPTTSEEEREAFSGRLGNRLFLPALIIPATALFGTLLYNYTPLGESGVFEAKRETYILLGLGVLIALAVIFAAFPVMAAAIGVPLLMQQYGGSPAVIGAIGMLAGFCGTLMTPMAANFNLVPAALLELKDRNGVIKAQIGTALPLLVANILLIYFLAFR
jgi:uncharacterized membrane protein